MTGKKTLIVDSSQIQAFLECPQYWAYSYRHNLAPHVQRQKEAMNKGTYLHKLLELYYKAGARTGPKLKENVEEALAYKVDEHTNCGCGHALDKHQIVPLKTDGFDTGSLQVCSLCTKTPNYLHPFERAPFPLSPPSRYEVQERFRMYALTHFATDFRAHNENTVEVGFSEPIYEDSDHLFILEGKIDLLGSLPASPENLIVDHKGQERAHDLYSKSVQFRNYSLVTGTKLMIINYIRFAKLAVKPFERKLISFSADEHRWWRQQLIQIYFSMLKHVESNFSLEDSHKWNRCKGEWGSPCEYTDLCEERDQKQLIQIKMQNNFVKKEEWRPW